MKFSSIAARNTLVIAVSTVTYSVVVGLALFALSELNERSAYSKIMSAELDHILSEKPTDQYSIDQRIGSEHIRFYGASAMTELPSRIRDLRVGAHHDIELDGFRWQMLVGEHDRRPYVFMLDITAWEAVEIRAFSYGLLVVLLLALLQTYLSVRASRYVLEPLSELTASVLILDPTGRTLNIPDQYHDKDIRHIAMAINQLINRVQDTIERERVANATTSHELRNSLGVIMGAVEILQRFELPPAGERARDRLARVTDEMHDLVEAILQLTREPDSTEQSPPLTDVAQIAESCISQLASVALAHGTELKLQIKNNFQTRVPAPYMRIICVNLLRNAIEHAPNGTVILQLKDKTLSVEDTGVGIPEPIQSHIFESGFTTREDGTGIGLSLLKRICDRYSLTIDVDSTPDRGTKFSVAFN